MNAPRKQRVDVCVVGAGVVGLAVAHELARRGRTVTVLEGARVGERAAAGVAAGMIAPASESDVSPPAVTRFALESHARYPQWIADLEASSGLSCAFEQVGTLWVAASRDDAAWLEHLRLFQQERGLATTLLTAREARELEPMLAPGVLGGLLARDDWQVNPRRLLPALCVALERQGGVLVEHTEVQDLTHDGTSWTVTAEQDSARYTVEAESVVIASGAWAGKLLGAHLLSPTQRPVKGQILRLRGAPIARHVLRVPEVYIVPRSDGEVVVGATIEEAGFDAQILAGAVHDLLRHARRVLPGIAELEFVEARAGFRPATRDHLPLIGAVGGRSEGLFVATGHYRNGVALAPATAQLLADVICEGAVHPLLEPFSPDRSTERPGTTQGAR